MSRRRRLDLALLLIVRRAERDTQLASRCREHPPEAARAIDRAEHPSSAPSEQPPSPAPEETDT